MAHQDGTPCVLVADDDPTIRDVLCDVLRKDGFRTLMAGDGDEVLPLAAAHRPALIVLDVLMPRMDGYTTLARLRSERETADIPVVLLTGQIEPIYRTLSAGVGAVAHLTKPVAPRQLTEVVRRILASPDETKRVEP